jgi:4-hydroxybenzoate polyprenyltransferase
MRQKATLKNYLALARFDHWIKQLFIVPGVVFAAALLRNAEPLVKNLDFAALGVRFALALLATCFIASANYIINEYLDAEFDKFHPTKSGRAAVKAACRPAAVYAMYAVFGLLGLALGWRCSSYVLLTEFILLIMGVVYNVRPMRSKEIPYVDVLSESVNNALRLLIGWFAVTSAYLPPVTIIFGFWMGGAFLMATKRCAEYRMIGDREKAARYRKSFARYTEQSLLVSAFFYALAAIFFVGVFMLKYRVELILAIPFLCGLFAYYLHISYKADSAAQKPEKLFREKGLMAYAALFVLIVAVLTFVRIPELDALTSTVLLGA